MAVHKLDRRPWRDRLQMTANGTYKANLFNACCAFRDAPEFRELLAYDEFSGTYCTLGPMPWDQRSHREWTEFDDLAATEWLQANDINVGVPTTQSAVGRVAFENRYHPVVDWLESLSWDGQPRIHDWLTYYLGALRTDYTQAVGRNFLISAVARVFMPGSKVDHVPVLEGEQGAMKSTCLRVLVGDAWFTDQLAELVSKDASQDLRGKWLVELSELSALKKNEVERVKAYLSRQIDHYRASYGRRTGDVPRQCVFVGTTNEDEYLKDDTGNRRFWPVKVHSVDIEALTKDREQIWAEAVQAYHDGEQWWMNTGDLVTAAKLEQEYRRVAHPWETIIADWLDDPRRTEPSGARVPYSLMVASGIPQVTNAEILQHAIGKPVERQAVTDQMAVGKILKRLGWRKRKGGHDNRVVWERSVED